MAGAADNPPDREHILDLLRAGEYDTALPLARDYVRDHGDDADMFYNLACLEARAGTPEQALAALRDAYALRLDVLDGARDDPDLASVQGDPAFNDLLAERDGRLALLAMERGADLGLAATSRVLNLHPTTPVGPDDLVSLDITWEPRGLRLDLKLTGLWSAVGNAASPAPWRGGPGAVVTLAVPDRDPAWTSGNFWLFAFGMETASPAGALWIPGQRRWQRVLELDPKARYNADGALELTLMLPWSSVMPFHPLVDMEMGLNVAVRAPAPDGSGYLVAELLPDGTHFTPSAPVRRVVPLTFDDETTDEETFLGRLDDSISLDTPLGIDLVGLTRAPGRAYLTVDVLDRDRRSVVPGGTRTGGMELVSGANRVSRELDFTGLDTGLYLVRATLEFPSGNDAVWSTGVLHLQTGWQDKLQTGIATLGDEDRPTAAYLLDQVTRAVADHLPRRHPGAIAATLADLRDMLERSRRQGSIMPEAGPFLLVADGPGGDLRVCPGYRTPAPAAANRRPVLVLTDLRGYEDRYVERIDRFMTYEKPTMDNPMLAPDFLLPGLVWPPVRVGDAPLAEARAALAWALERYGVEQLELAGVGFAAGVALQLAAAEPQAVSRLALLVGKDLAPWPEAPDNYIATRLEGLDRNLPVTWYDFDDETRIRSQAGQIRGVMSELGMTAVTDVRITGALNLTQAADRIVLWGMARPQ
ncbi:hypothetical protein DRQ50_08745 [bacterium]|nr:MAG: hypothetical protein DRQ50_08745 [bacterium]